MKLGLHPHLPAALVLATLLLPGCLTNRLNERALHPRERFDMIPEDLDLLYETICVPVDGAAIHAWFLPAPGADRTVIVCGGNTGNRGPFLPLAREFRSAGYNTVLFDYRGFGLSTGEPDLWSLVPDAEALLEVVAARADAGEIALLGVSLGSVVALGVADRRPEQLRAVAVEAAFDPEEKLDQMVGSFLGTLGAWFVVPSGWDVPDHARNLELPVLFIHGTEDWITPIEEAERIFAEAEGANSPRVIWIAEGAGHAPGIAGALGTEYVDRVVLFLDACFEGRTPEEPADASPEYAYHADRAAWDRLEDEVFESLGYGGFTRISGVSVFIRVGEGPAVDEILAACDELSAEIDAVLSRPVDPLVRPLYGDAYHAIGSRYAENERPREALAAFEKYLELLPEKPYAFFRYYDAGWDMGANLGKAAATLVKMAGMVEDAAASEAYLRRADKWQGLHDARSERIDAFMEEQRSYLPGGSLSR